MRAEHEAVPVAGGLQFHVFDHLAVAAVQVLGDAQQRRPDTHGAALGGGQRRQRAFRFLGPPATVVLRHERDGLDLLGLEPAEPAVADQVVRVLVMVLVRDVPADVVQQRRVFEPLACAVSRLVDAARLVEQREGQAGHVLGVLAVPAAPLAEFDDAAPADVGIPLDGGDVLAIAIDVVEDEPLAQREVRQRHLLGVEQPHDRVEQDGAGDNEVGTAGIESRQAQPPLHVEGDHLLARAVKGLGRNPGMVDGIAVEQTAAGQRHFPQAETGA